MQQPYFDSALYTPHVTRGVSVKEQPYTYKLVNSVINHDDLNGDTMSMRKIVTGDMLTKALDWAAKKKFPLPPKGSEFYIFIGDDAKDDMKDFFIGVYSRRRRFKNYLIPFPDYSYQVFSTSSRFHIRDAECMSWGDTKEYILKSIKTIKPTVNNIFFRGNDVSLTGIRKDLWYIQNKHINTKPPLPLNTLKIEIPKLDIGKEDTPMSIPQMGKYKVLLDLPGYGMWSTRLKFISLTDSTIIRILYYTHFYNNDSNQWIMADRDGDTWETFADGFLPIDVTHTLMVDRYSYDNIKEPKMKEFAKTMNIKAKAKMMNELSALYKNINTPKVVEKSMKARNIVRSLTDDHLMEFVYNFIMNQYNYYNV
jgi:hypothetical protein